MSDNTFRSLAYEAFISGKSVTEADQIIDLPITKIKKYYTDFICAETEFHANNLHSKLMQIRAIERELFAAISENKKNAKATYIDTIDQLQDTYSRFCL